MAIRLPDAAQQLKPETINSLQQLVRALQDSIAYHVEAADKVDDDNVQQTLKTIARERTEICDGLCGFISMADEKPVQDGSTMGKLRTIWTSLRAGLNAGDAKVVLIEAERAEDAIVHQFQEVLPEIAGNPLNSTLLGYFEKIKTGHDRVLGLRNAYQASA